MILIRKYVTMQMTVVMFFFHFYESFLYRYELIIEKAIGPLQAKVFLSGRIRISAEEIILQLLKVQFVFLPQKIRYFESDPNP